VPEAQKARIQQLARDPGLMNAVTPQTENSVACVSFPTCTRPMAEAERFLPSFIAKVEGGMSKHGRREEHNGNRGTGRTNRSRPALLAEEGLAAEAPAGC
ncbi:sulfite reductase subunit beta, partial [Klebsiella pneumoniae]